jgi:RNA ligase
MTKIDRAIIEEQIAAGFIQNQRHPTAPLTVFNYTPRAQWENHWPPVVKACRGLILADDGRVVARPFEKFFNYDQVIAEIPAEPFEAFEKMDGSLGIHYWDGDNRCIATRGSFTSDQARFATQLLRQKYAHTIAPADLTLLFEIIYPGNRIVVNYGDREELVLLAAFDTQTGDELPFNRLSDFGFPVVQRMDGIRDLAAIQSLNRDNFEGFVIRFASGFRCKIKLAEYVRLHRLLTGITPRAVWEELRSGRGLDALVERVPDEFMRWLREVESKIRANFTAIETECRRVHRTNFPTRKLAADYIKQQQYPSILFQLLDGRDPSESIWKLVYPEASRAFRCDEAP